jgi:hypothetical protein
VYLHDKHRSFGQTNFWQIIKEDWLLVPKGTHVTCKEFCGFSKVMNVRQVNLLAYYWWAFFWVVGRKSLRQLQKKKTAGRR